MALERRLEGRDQLLKLVKRYAREIQELHRTGLQLGEPYTWHGSCLLSLYGDVRGASYQKESGINSDNQVDRVFEVLKRRLLGVTPGMRRREHGNIRPPDSVLLRLVRPLIALENHLEDVAFHPVMLSDRGVGIALHIGEV